MYYTCFKRTLTSQLHCCYSSTVYCTCFKSYILEMPLSYSWAGWYYSPSHIYIKAELIISMEEKKYDFEVSQGTSNRSLENYGFISDTIFKKLVCMCTNHLALKQLLFKIAELEIRLRAWRQGESLASTVDSVFEQTDSSANTAYIYWGSLRGQTCHSVIDGKPQLQHAPAANKKCNKM